MIAVEHEHLIEYEDKVYRGYAETRSGDKLHLCRPGLQETVCGCVPSQMVLVESPVPMSSLCDWCRAHLERESRGH